MAILDQVKKIGMWVGIGLVVIAAEIGLAVFAVQQLHPDRSAKAAVENQEDAAGDTLAVDESKVVPVQEETAEKPAEVKKKPVKNAGNMDDADFDIEGVYTLSDFVINPAFSQGKHFFVTSIVFAFKDKTLRDALVAREPILQDRIIVDLGKKTFAWFGDEQNKISLRDELAQIACDVLGIEGGVKVYFTKYVLQ